MDLIIPPAAINPFPPSSFLDNGFTIKNHTDSSKAFIFDASQISTGTTRTYIMPDKNGTVALLSDVVGLWDDRGNWDPTSRTAPANYPNINGSGIAGAILKGDTYTISVAGTLGTTLVGIGDVVRALSDTPGDTASNWDILAGAGIYLRLSGGTITGTTAATSNSNGALAIAGGLSVGKNYWVGGNYSGTAITKQGMFTHTQAATFTDNATSGTIALGVGNYYGVPTYTSSGSAVTVTNGAVIYIDGNFTGSGSVTVTNGYGLYNNGSTFLAGSLTLGTNGLSSSGALSLFRSIPATANGVGSSINLNVTAGAASSFIFGNNSSVTTLGTTSSWNFTAGFAATYTAGAVSGGIGGTQDTSNGSVASIKGIYSHSGVMTVTAAQAHLAIMNITSTGNVTWGAGFRTATFGIASTGTFGTISDYYAEDQTLSGITAHAYYSNMSAGTNKYSYYSNGTAVSYFKGAVGIGVLPNGNAFANFGAATASLSSFQITSTATLPSTPRDGGFEYTGGLSSPNDTLYFSVNNSGTPARQIVALIDGTSVMPINSIPYTNSSGRFISNSNLSYDGTVLNVASNFRTGSQVTFDNISVSAPNTNTLILGPSIAVFGSPSIIQGAPDAWLNVIHDGQNGVIPFYNK